MSWFDEGKRKRIKIKTEVKEESVRLSSRSVCRSLGRHNIQLICAHTVLLFMALTVTIILSLPQLYPKNIR